VRVVLGGLGTFGLAGQLDRDRRTQVDDGGLATGLLDPLSNTRSAPAVDSTSLGRGSYSWGSLLGARTWVSWIPSPPTLRTKSPSWVVVATTLSWRPDPELPEPADGVWFPPHAPAASTMAVVRAAMTTRRNGRGELSMGVLQTSIRMIMPSIIGLVVRMSSWPRSGDEGADLGAEAAECPQKA